eukprot:jgi/Antlo1/271/1580
MLFIFAFLLCLVHSDLIRLKFVANNHLYLALDRTFLAEPKFVPVSRHWTQVLPNYCGVASRRNIDNNFNELFFCGFKMCYDEGQNTVRGCKGNEHDTMWELVLVDDNTYVIKNSENCITLIGESRVEMKRCSTKNIEQMFIVEPYDRKKPIRVDTDVPLAVRELNIRNQMRANEEFFRRESLLV